MCASYAEPYLKLKSYVTCRHDRLTRSHMPSGGAVHPVQSLIADGCKYHTDTPPETCASVDGATGVAAPAARAGRPAVSAFRRRCV
jgi:hypothetical protein